MEIDLFKKTLGENSMRKLYLVTVNVFTTKDNVCIDKYAMIGGLFKSKRKAQVYAKSIINDGDSYNKREVAADGNISYINMIITPLIKNKIMYCEDYIEKGWLRGQPPLKEANDLYNAFTKQNHE